MIQISEYQYQAEEGKVFVHKTSGQRYGNGIYLGLIDSIDNYFEDDIKPEDFPSENPEDEEK